MGKSRCIIFTAVQSCTGGLAMAKPSVCPSVRQTRALWQNERTFCQHSSTIWKVHSYSLPIRRMVGGGRPLLPEILGQSDRPPFKNADFQPIFARSDSAV